MEKPVWKPCPHRVFALKDPREADSLRSIRYVGVTSNNLKSRLASIVAEAKQNRGTPYLAWVRELLALGLKPAMSEVRAAPSAKEAKKALEAALKTYRAAGCPLLQ